MLLSTAGLELGIATGVGAAAGWYLDQRFDTAPWLTLFLLIAGVIAGFKNLLRISRRALDHTFAQPEEPAPDDPPDRHHDR